MLRFSFDYLCPGCLKTGQGNRVEKASKYLFLRALHHTHTEYRYDSYFTAYDHPARLAPSDNKGIFHTYSGSSKDNLIFFLFAFNLALGFDIAELSLFRNPSSATSSSWMTLAFLRFF